MNVVTTVVKTKLIQLLIKKTDLLKNPLSGFVSEDGNCGILVFHKDSFIHIRMYVVIVDQRVPVS